MMDFDDICRAYSEGDIDFLIRYINNINCNNMVDRSRVFFIFTASCRDGMEEIVNHILNKDCICNCDKNDVFLQACEKGNINIVKKLLDSGVDVNYTDNCGNNSLMLACKHTNNIQLVNLLILNGVDVNVKNKNDISCLNFVCETNNVVLAKILLDNGAKLSSRGDKHYSEFITSCRNENVEMLRLLLQYNVDIYENSEYGTTGMAISCICNNVKAIKMIILTVKNIDVRRIFGIYTLDTLLTSMFRCRSYESLTYLLLLDEIYDVLINSEHKENVLKCISRDEYKHNKRMLLNYKAVDIFSIMVLLSDDYLQIKPLDNYFQI